MINKTLSVIGASNLPSITGVTTIDNTTETTFENTLDIAGDVVGTGLNDVSVEKIKGVELGEVEAEDGNILMAQDNKWESLPTTEITSIGVIEEGTWEADPIQPEFLEGVWLTNGLTYVFPAAHTTNGFLLNNGTGTLTWTTIGASGITADSLDFTEFKDDMTLDANTTIDTNGFALALGNDATDTITVNGRINSDIVPSANGVYALGSDSLRWSKLYLTDIAAIGGQATFTAEPTGTAVGNGALYINPPSVDSGTYTVFGIAVSGVEKLRIDADGNITLQGDLIGPTTGVVGHWTRTGTTLSPTINTDNITTLGSVGIGTATLDATRKLEVVAGLVGMNAQTAIYASSVHGGAAVFGTNDSVGTGVFGINTLNGMGVAGTSVSGSGTYGSTTSGYGVRGISIDTGYAGHFTSAGGIGGYFSSTSGLAALVTGTGSVGFGTPTPTGRLQVVGDEVRIGDAGTVDYATADGDLYVEDALEVDGTLYAGGISSTGSLLPSADNTYDLGSAALRWQDIYLGPASLNISDTTGTSGAGTDYVNSTLGFSGEKLVLATSLQGAQATGGNILIQSAYPLGGATNEAIALKTTTDLGATDEMFQVGDSAEDFLTVLGNGNAGIGTTNPGAKLEVYTSGSAVANFTSTHDTESVITHNAAAGTAAHYSQYVGDIPTISVDSNSNEGYLTTSSNMPIFFKTNLIERMGLGSTGGLALGSTYFSIDPGANNAIFEGKVGIGITSPTGKLQVVGDEVRIGDAGTVDYATADGDLYVEDALEVDGNAYLATLFLAGTQVTSSGAELNILDGATVTAAELNMLDGTTVTNGGVMFGNGTYMTQDATNFFWDDTNNRLGLGTASPASFLHVLGTTEQLRLGYDASNYTSFTIDSTGSLTLADTGTNMATFGEANAEFFVPTAFSAAGDVSIAYDLVFTNQTTSNIKSNGPLAIESGESFENNDLTLRTFGTGNVVMDLSGTGNLTMQGTDTSIVFDTKTATDTDYWMGVIDEAGGDDDDLFVIGDGTVPGTNPFVTVTTSGNVGIGTTNPGVKLDVNGIIQANNGDGFVDPSAGVSSGTRFSLNSTTATNIYGIGLGAIDGSQYPMWFQTGLTNGGGFEWYIGTSEKMRIDKTGKVGIGTTSPSYGLDVQVANDEQPLFRAVRSGVTTRGMWMNTRGIAVFGIPTVGPTTNYAIDFDIGLDRNSAAGAISEGILVDADITPTTGGTDFAALAVRGTVNQTGGANGITRGVFITPTLTSAANYRAVDIANNSGYAIYQSGTSANNFFAGYVGIGTTDPSQALDVIGNIELSGNIGLAGSAPEATTLIKSISTVTPGTGTFYGLDIEQTNDTTDSLSNNLSVTSTAAAGTVGFLEALGAYTTVSGTADVSQAFGVEGWTAHSSASGTIADARGVMAGVSRIGGAGGVITSASAITAQIYGNAGTIDSAYGLNVGSWLKSATVNNSYGIYMDNTIGIGTNNWALYSASTADSYFAGDVGIGITTPGAKLDVNGTVKVQDLTTAGGGDAVLSSGGILTTVASSQRYKTDIQNLSFDLDKILTLNPVTFKWGENTATPGMEDFGMIAEDTAAAIPQLATYEQDGTTIRGLKYNMLGVVAISGLKQQQTLIDEASQTGQTALASVSDLENNLANKLLETETNIDNLTADIGDIRNELDNAKLQIEDLLAKQSSETAQSSESSSSAPIQPEGILAEVTKVFEEFKDFVSSLGLSASDKGLLVSSDMNVIGDTTLSDLTITGDLMAGMIQVDTLDNAINVFGSECTNSDSDENKALCENQTLYIQKTKSGYLDIFDGTIAFKTNGDITTEGSITTKGSVLAAKISVDTSIENASAGHITIKSGEKSVEVTTKALTSESLIFVTPDKPVAVGSKKSSDSDDRFVIELSENALEDIKVSWWVIN
ncbi:MAG: cell wall surface anchor family protein [uncultured bacterium]|nr:MAG: cell wall surface anchor family protein [uncultured bacterium]